MVFEHIEKLKQQYTDKYVVVDESRPELRRFRGMTGTVRTVNMSGRALVEFDANANIGWFDISLDCLKVIDKPLPKPDDKAGRKAEAKEATKPAPAKKAPAEAAAKAPAAKPGGGLSVQDVLAAAREKGRWRARPSGESPACQTCRCSRWEGHQIDERGGYAGRRAVRERRRGSGCESCSCQGRGPRQSRRASSCSRQEGYEVDVRGRNDVVVCALLDDNHVEAVLREDTSRGCATGSRPDDHHVAALDPIRCHHRLRIERSRALARRLIVGHRTAGLGSIRAATPGSRA